jgi:peptidoglycan hydrolase CwlO-like protein
MIGTIIEIATAVGGYILSQKVNRADCKLEDVRNGLTDLSKKYNDDAEMIKKGMVSLDDAVRNQRDDLEKLQKSLSTVELELRSLRDIATKRLYLTYGFGSLAFLALVLAVISIAR